MTSELVRTLVDDILDKYEKREKTQAQLVDYINEKYNVELVLADIQDITQQAGIFHTIKRDDLIHVVTYLSESLRRKLNIIE